MSATPGNAREYAPGNDPANLPEKPEGPPGKVRLSTPAEMLPLTDDPGLVAKQTGLDRFSYDDAIVRKFLWATIVWGLVAFLAGIYVATLLVLPGLRDVLVERGMVNAGNAIDWLIGIEWLTFGRLRPLHTNAAIFAFAGNGIFAAIYYSTQRLCKARMFSDRLSKLHFWGWQLVIVSAALTLPAGITQGKEYAELEWPIDLMIAVVWVGFFGVNFFGTLIKRRERHMYVALWFYIATIVTVAVLHVFNNLWIPMIAGTSIKSYPIYAGVQDAMVQWWYGHNAVAFFLTTPFLGMMYYFLPKAAQRPVFSYRLSIIHFWSIVFVYIWAGPHHLHYSAVPDWASSLGMVFSLMLWMPSWGGMINGLLTLRGAWHKVAQDPVLKFFVVAITFYGMSTFEGPMLSIKAVNSLSHFTDWTIAHVHAGALGWNGFMVYGMAYWIAPRLFQTKLYSEKMVSLHFWLGTIGILLYIIAIYFAGITQGLMWKATNSDGTLAYAFMETVGQLIPFYWIRIVGGLCFFAGALIGAVNLVMTWRKRPGKYEVPVIQAAPLSKEPYTGDAKKPATTMHGTTDFAQSLSIFNTMWWHRAWERRPIKFTVLVLVAVIVASLFEMIPTFVIKSNVPTIASVQPYTPLELYGRDIYLSEGCYNCHSQMIRPLLDEDKRYGEFAKPGEFVYDHPFQWGSRRIGPDIQRVGMTKPDTGWHLEHFWNPAFITPKSMMPSYKHLYIGRRSGVEWSSIKARVSAMSTLGVPYTEEQVAKAEQDARDQAQAIADAFIETNQGPYIPLGRDQPVDIADKKVIALIAYMQRLGTDLFKAPPTEACEPTPTPALVSEPSEKATAQSSNAPATLGMTGGAR